MLAREFSAPFYHLNWNSLSITPSWGIISRTSIECFQTMILLTKIVSVVSSVVESNEDYLLLADFLDKFLIIEIYNVSVLNCCTQKSTCKYSSFFLCLTTYRI